MAVANTAGSGSGAGAGHDHTISQIPQGQFDCSGRMDGYYANPTSCSSYYICVSGMGLMSDCHPGLLYNEVSGYCDFPDHVTCNTQSTQAPAQAQTTMAPAPAQAQTTQAPPVTATTVRTTTRAPPTTTRATTTTTTRRTTTTAATQPPAGGQTDPKDFCKGKADGFHRDPADCAKFYQCWSGTAYHESCPTGTYFDLTMKGCNFKANVSCP